MSVEAVSLTYVDPSPLSSENLLTIYDPEKIRLGVIGLGYVGLPVCIAAAKAGLSVLGFDIDVAKTQALQNGKSYIHHIPSTHIQRILSEGQFRATEDFSYLREVDAILICVPTPLTKQREPDLSAIIATTHQILPYLKPGHLVVLESTTYPGTTRDIVKPILERSGLISGQDFFLAFSPEREDPGNVQFSLTRVPKVVGGDGEIAVRLAQQLYNSFAHETVAVSSTEAAEAVKLTENIFRCVNIALVNELKTIYSAMGIDIWEVIEAAKTKPFGFMPFYPGPGLGGHCIPIDPFYLSWKAKEYEVSTRFIDLAGEINTCMPAYVVTKLAEALDSHFQKGLKGAHLLILGLAYKKNIDDCRESPALKIISLLAQRQSQVDYYDPYVPSCPPHGPFSALKTLNSVFFSPDVLQRYDAVVIITDHDCVDYGCVLQNAKLVVDTRNACRRQGHEGPNLVLA